MEKIKAEAAETLNIKLTSNEEQYKKVLKELILQVVSMQRLFRDCLNLWKKSWLFGAERVTPERSLASSKKQPRNIPYGSRQRFPNSKTQILNANWQLIQKNTYQRWIQVKQDCLHGKPQIIPELVWAGSSWELRRKELCAITPWTKDLNFATRKHCLKSEAYYSKNNHLILIYSLF